MSTMVDPKAGYGIALTSVLALSLAYVAKRRWAPADASSLPPWFKPDKMIRPLHLDSAIAFRDMEVLDDDVLVCSYPKAGTSWIHSIVTALLRTDADGQPLPVLDNETGAQGQLYPDAVPLERPRRARRQYGFASFRALREQPVPRLFSTHMREGMLPAGLSERGKLVYMMRNPKDTLTSLHFFLKKVAGVSANKLAKVLAEEDWFGSGDNETGSYNRFNVWPEERSSWWCGSYYAHVLAMDALVRSLGKRARVMYYERLHENLPGEIRGLGDFLGVPMSDAKVKAVMERTSSAAMANRLQLRKGVVGDHMKHLTPRHWQQMDQWFAERLRGAEIAKPLAKYMGSLESASS
eukprot:CAMPEP_0171072698 /NCGR_PEP_ID=MMETSP0766_2-20121228/11023_1 /TAXON_ID=439317 /ORGANISM="Gambierdiscus australes, Strain CAWD 149" /LENGTH=350 /DNA_ID=CAMNT_0011529307 /DNA_START=38 /DNA_END=1090 /DNA_ORIENTATION=-